MSNQNNYERMLEVKNRFQPFIKNPKLIYTYIAPKDPNKLASFEKYIANLPTVTGSLYEILSDPSTVRQALSKLDMLESCELDIYMASDDSYSSVMIKGTLADYIRKEKIDFQL